MWAERVQRYQYYDYSVWVYKGGGNLCLRERSVCMIEREKGEECIFTIKVIRYIVEGDNLCMRERGVHMRMRRERENNIS